MPDYIIETPVNHDGKEYRPGDKITLDAAVAEPLLAVLAVSALSGSAGGRPNANDAIARIKEAATTEALDIMAEGEDRKSVLAAIDIRRKELAPEGAE